MRRAGIYVCIYINAHLMVNKPIHTRTYKTRDITYIDTRETNKVKDDISK